MEEGGSWKPGVGIGWVVEGVSWHGGWSRLGDGGSVVATEGGGGWLEEGVSWYGGWSRLGRRGSVVAEFAAAQCEGDQSPLTASEGGAMC